MTQINLPFKVDQIVEVKSFIAGYRGAWFRCKILEMFSRKGELHYKLKYLDYPDEKVHQTKVFQKFGGKVHLMVRPKYPPHYHESELLKIKIGQEPLIVIHDSWKVGDFVDWWANECYWSGKILEVKENETLQVELLPRPVGEGNIYEALFKDLRPLLDWTLDDGWKLPSMDGQTRQCAKLVKQLVKHNNKDICETREEQAKRATKHVKSDDGLRLNIMESESIEAAFCDLEEALVRIEWLKGILSPDGGEGSKSYWKYQDYRPPSKGK